MCALQGQLASLRCRATRTRAQREKTERESTEEPPPMRTLADTAPRCRGPAHYDDRGTDCDCFDQELAIGTRPTTVKELPARVRGFPEDRACGRAGPQVTSRRVPPRGAVRPRCEMLRTAAVASVSLECLGGLPHSGVGLEFGNTTHGLLTSRSGDGRDRVAARQRDQLAGRARSRRSSARCSGPPARPSCRSDRRPTAWPNRCRPPPATTRPRR